MRARPASPSDYSDARLAAFESDSEEEQGALRPPSPRTPPPLFGEVGDQDEVVRTPDAPNSTSTLDLTSTPPPLELTPTALPATTTASSSVTPSTLRAPPLIPLAHQRRIQSTAVRKANSGQRRKYRKKFPPWTCIPCGVVCVDRISKEVHTKGKKHRSKVNYLPQNCASCEFTAYHPNDFQRHINGARHKRRIGKK